MSNYAKAGFLHNGDEAVTIGPETVNGTGQVYLDADPVRFLSNEQARELGAALIAAADYAGKVRAEMEEWPVGRPPGSVREYEWTDPGWHARPDEGEQHMSDQPGPGHHVLREPGGYVTPDDLRRAAKLVDPVTVPRHELDVLLAVATLYLNSFTEDEAMAFTEAFAYTNVQEIVEKHGRSY